MIVELFVKNRILEGLEFEYLRKITPITMMKGSSRDAMVHIGTMSILGAYINMVM